MAISDNLNRFRESLDEAGRRYGRKSEEIRLMAVSKTRSVEEIREARKAGLDLFGENRVEEASGKFAELDSEHFPLVLIGHLQSNKVSRIDQRFSAVHSVDSEKLASRLSRKREEIRRPLEILLQVNTSGEVSKSGFNDVNEMVDAAGRISEMPYLQLRGLMTMAPFVDDEGVVRDCFSRCRRWSEEIAFCTGESPILSMGMSSDYEWAVAEGSTMLRIGTTFFGGR